MSGGQIKAFAIPDDWKTTDDSSGTVEMPIFTKILSAGYDQHRQLTVWGIVQDTWKDQMAPYRFQIRKPNDTIESDDESLDLKRQFISMVHIDGEPQAVFFGGSTVQ